MRTYNNNKKQVKLVLPQDQSNESRTTARNLHAVAENFLTDKVASDWGAGTGERWTDEIKYLGVIVDKDLSWRSHIEKVRKKCLSALAVLHKIKGSLPPKLRSVLYQSMVLPHLDYCAVVWAECCKDDATKLERIHKSGMRLILNEGWNCLSSVMRSRLGWTSLANWRRTMRAAYIRRCM